MNLLDFIFPKRCVSCGSFGRYLCSDCTAEIKFIEAPICPVCERPAIGGAAHPGCRTRYSLDGLISVCIYEGPVKMAIKRLKYKPWTTDLGKILADLAFSYLQNAPINYLIKAKPTVAPVPLHHDRERYRGFNQSEVLGRLLAGKLNLEVTANVLIRHKKTKTQAELKGRERLENIRGAFALSRPYTPTRPFVLLIDDVWTTGATLKACCDVLKRAGVKKVWALVLAR
ncbi:MAG: ComF family protein [bacterium]|nr:ComF family protein [bacterium]